MWHYGIDRRGWGPQGLPILSIATKDREEGQCREPVRLPFVCLHKGIEGTSNVIRGRKFWDIEKGPTPESWKDSRALLLCLPTQSRETDWASHTALHYKDSEAPRPEFKKKMPFAHTPAKL